MATVVYSGRALEHIAQSFAWLAKENPDAATGAMIAIRSAVENLAVHPLIGRRVHADVRELVISYGDTGYVALYRFVIPSDEVRILALRHQRQLGYTP